MACEWFGPARCGFSECPNDAAGLILGTNVPVLVWWSQVRNRD